MLHHIPHLASGKYVLEMENSSGKKTATVTVRVQDSPGPPGPISVKEVTLESAAIAWEQPVNDGGALITNYIVEKKESTMKAWSTVATQCTRTSYNVQGLEAGKSYLFRYVNPL